MQERTEREPSQPLGLSQRRLCDSITTVGVSNSDRDQEFERHARRKLIRGPLNDDRPIPEGISKGLERLAGSQNKLDCDQTIS